MFYFYNVKGLRKQILKLIVKIDALDVEIEYYGSNYKNVG